MTISRSTSFVNVGMLLLVLLVAFCGLKLNSDILENRDVMHEKEETIALAKELMESSQALTSNVRLYAATGDPSFAKAYFAVLAVRLGKEPRPQESFVAPGERMALIDLIKQSHFTESELRLVEESYSFSAALTKMEDVALGAVSKKAGHFERHLLSCLS